MLETTFEKPKVHEILRMLMAQKNINEASLARECSIPQPTLHRILSGETTSPRGVSLIPLANYFGVSINQLLGEDALPEELNTELFSMPIYAWTTLPLIPWSLTPEWASLKITLKKRGWEQWITTDAPVNDDAYAVLMEGDSMSPLFPENTLLVMAPYLTAKPGDYVIAQYGPRKSITVKQYIVENKQEYLKPVHPEFSTFMFDENTMIFGVLIQARMDRSRNSKTSCNPG